MSDGLYTLGHECSSLRGLDALRILTKPSRESRPADVKRRPVEKVDKFWSARYSEESLDTVPSVKGIVTARPTAGSQLKLSWRVEQGGHGA